MDGMRCLWFIDDREDNLAAWRAAFDFCAPGKLNLRTFGSFAEWEVACKSEKAPDAAFVDFFIQGNYGHEAIALLRQCHGALPIVVAHSSSPEANLAMLKVGADCAMPKLKGASPSPTILAAFPDLAALEAWLSNKILRG